MRRWRRGINKETYQILLFFRTFTKVAVKSRLKSLACWDFESDMQAKACGFLPGILWRRLYVGNCISLAGCGCGGETVGLEGVFRLVKEIAEGVQPMMMGILALNPSSQGWGEGNLIFPTGRPCD